MDRRGFLKRGLAAGVIGALGASALAGIGSKPAEATYVPSRATVSSVSNAFTAPTDTPPEGTERYLYDASGRRIKAAYINGAWCGVELGTM